MRCRRVGGVPLVAAIFTFCCLLSNTERETTAASITSSNTTSNNSASSNSSSSSTNSTSNSTSSSISIGSNNNSSNNYAIAADVYPSDDDRQLHQWIRSEQFLQMELFTMATGNYLAFPDAVVRYHDNDDDDDDDDSPNFAVISGSVSRLWSQLSTMRQVDDVVATVTREMSRLLKDLVVYRETVNFVCQKIDRLLTDDRTTLGVEYRRTKNVLQNGRHVADDRTPTAAVVVAASSSSSTSTSTSSTSPATTPSSTSNETTIVYLWRTLDEVADLPANKMAAWLGATEIRKLLVNGDFLSYVRPPAPSSTLPASSSSSSNVGDGGRRHDRVQNDAENVGNDEGERRRHVMASALVRMAQNDSRTADRVQRLYAAAVAETADEINDSLDFRQVKFRLFDKLAAKIRDDPSLEAKFVSIRADATATATTSSSSSS